MLHILKAENTFFVFLNSCLYTMSRQQMCSKIIIGNSVRSVLQNYEENSPRMDGILNVQKQQEHLLLRLKTRFYVMRMPLKRADS